MNEPDAKFELEDSAGVVPVVDRRPRVPEPVPVVLAAVADVTFVAAPGVEAALDAFYVALLGFARDVGPMGLCYRADNFRIWFELREPVIEREAIKPLGVELTSVTLGDFERKLIDRESAYQRHKSITPGCDSILVQDPGGNWLEVVARRAVM